MRAHPQCSQDTCRLPASRSRRCRQARHIFGGERTRVGHVRQRVGVRGRSQAGHDLGARRLPRRARLMSSSSSVAAIAPAGGSSLIFMAITQTPEHVVRWLRSPGVALLGDSDLSAADAVDHHIDALGPDHDRPQRRGRAAQDDDIADPSAIHVLRVWCRLGAPRGCPHRGPGCRAKDRAPSCDRPGNPSGRSDGCRRAWWYRPCTAQ